MKTRFVSQCPIFFIYLILRNLSVLASVMARRAIIYLRAACPALLGPCHHRFGNPPLAERLTVLFSALTSVALWIPACVQVSP